MHRAAGQPRQADVARDQDRLGRRRNARQAKTGGELSLGRAAAARQRRILRMLHDPGAEAASVRQHQPHQTRGRDRARAVGERDGSRLTQQAEFRQRLPATAGRGRAIGQDRDGAGFPAAGDQHVHQSGIVDRRRTVGQRRQRGDAARRGRRSGRHDRFAISNPGSPKATRISTRPGHSTAPSSCTTAAPSGRPREGPKSAITPSRSSRSPCRSIPSATIADAGEQGVRGHCGPAHGTACPAPPYGPRPPSRPVRGSRCGADRRRPRCRSRHRGSSGPDA